MAAAQLRRRYHINVVVPFSQNRRQHMPVGGKAEVKIIVHVVSKRARDVISKRDLHDPLALEVSIFARVESEKAASVRQPHWTRRDSVFELEDKVLFSACSINRHETADGISRLLD